MKHIVTAFIYIGILIFCNSSDKTKKAIQKSSDTEIVVNNPSNKSKKQLKAIDTDKALIATALMAAPKESRSRCKVIGYNMAGEFVTLREGDNEFIVLVDNPKQDGFSAVYYHKDLEPFMARGRVLRAEGKQSKKSLQSVEKKWNQENLK